MSGRRVRSDWLPDLMAGLVALLAGGALLRLLARRAPIETVEEDRRQAPVEVARARPDTIPHLPAPSVWPVVVGAGVALSLFGIVTSLAFSLLGLVLLLVGIGGWIGELRHERDHAAPIPE